MMMKRKMIALLSISLFSVGAFAEAGSNQAQEQQVNPSSQAERWLELQREGSQASLNKQYLSGPAMENIHKRYLESFTRPIPERFDPGQFNRQ